MSTSFDIFKYAFHREVVLIRCPRASAHGHSCALLPARTFPSRNYSTIFLFLSLKRAFIPVFRNFSTFFQSLATHAHFLSSLSFRFTVVDLGELMLSFSRLRSLFVSAGNCRSCFSKLLCICPPCFAYLLCARHPCLRNHGEATLPPPARSNHSFFLHFYLLISIFVFFS